MSDEIINLIAQIIGIIAMAGVCFSFQIKSTSGILKLHVTCNCLWILHYFILGAYTGAMLNLFSAVRNITYYDLNKKKVKNRNYYAFCFCIGCILLSLMTFENWWSILPMIGSAIHTFGFSCRKANSLRLMTLGGLPFWFTYNLVNRSYSGMFTEIISSISLIIALVRYKNKEDKKCHKQQ